VPASNGTPTIATSQLSTSLNSGSLANVEGPANLGTLVPANRLELDFCYGLFSLINKLYHILFKSNII
jgi:hypothetical protein